jgi:hypothetical protein
LRCQGIETLQLDERETEPEETALNGEHGDTNGGYVNKGDTLCVHSCLSCRRKLSILCCRSDGGLDSSHQLLTGKGSHLAQAAFRVQHQV